MSTKLSYDGFKNYLLTRPYSYIPSEYEDKFRTIEVKRIKKEALVILFDDENSENISGPSVSIENLFETYQRYDFAFVCLEIKKLINGYFAIKALRNQCYAEKLSKENVMKNVIPVLTSNNTPIKSKYIKRTNNTADVACMKWHDFNVFFNIVDSEEEDLIFATLTKQHIESLKLDIDELFKKSLENFNKFFQPIIEESPIYNSKSQKGVFKQTMCIITTQEFLFGSSYLLNNNLLNKIAEFYNGSFYILPFSTNEIFAFPTGVTSEEKLLKTIHDANKKITDKELFLSNSLYLYSKEEQKIKLIKK